MLDYQPLYDVLKEQGCHAWVSRLPEQISRAFAADNHGDMPNWQGLLMQLPGASSDYRDATGKAITIGQSQELASHQTKHISSLLSAFHPWRKGPYEIFGITIDSEWRSDWKWQRLQQGISSLENRLVLDVGCGNGYHCWRMYGAGAKLVVGIDPTMLSVMQFQVVRKIWGAAPVYILPLGIEDIPAGLRAFNTVFSMGVLYHRRSPLDHLLELRECLQPGGELVLETLVIDGKSGEVLLPEGRYAKMRNVWFLPSCETLTGWLKRCGFVDIKLLNVCKTSTEEQRATPWMRFQSLADFLDPQNPAYTIEGLPAPVRAIFVATRA